MFKWMKKLTPDPRKQGAKVSFANDAKGVAAIEMAMIFPVMLVIFTGIVDTTSMFSAGRKVSIAASSMGDLISQVKAKVKKSDIDGYVKALGPIMEPLPQEHTGMDIHTFRLDKNKRVKLLWKYRHGSISCGAQPQSDKNMAKLMVDGNDITVTRVCHDHSLIIGYLFGKITKRLHGEVTMRSRLSSTIDCKDCTT
jgi:hypothetical protein